MGPRAELLEDEDGTVAELVIYCPGCDEHHPIRVKGDRADGAGPWKWNGDLVNPTVSPSLLCNKSDPATRCHSFIKNGNWQFLGDCFHELAGQTVPIPEGRLYSEDW